MTQKEGDKTDPLALFESAVLNGFAFLQEQYGFSNSTRRPTQQGMIVRYESPTLFVNLTFGPPEFEAGMSFGRLGIDDQQDGFSFCAGDLILLQSRQEWAASNRKSQGIIEGQVNWFASLLNECGKPCLLGNSETYEKMKSKRETQLEEWRREERNTGRSKGIEAAWKLKNYPAVVAYCAGYEGALSDIDKKRLAIAKANV